MYVPIIKTGEAEVKAITKLSANMIAGICPIIELTRGRQRTKNIGTEKQVSFPFDNRLAKIKDVFRGKTVFLDLTTDESLLSNEIHDLYDSREGYNNWLELIRESVGEEGFGSIIPAVLFNWDDEDFETNFKYQIEKLARRCGAVMYRSSIQTKDCYDELPLILKYLPSDCDLWIVLDGGYLQDSAVTLAQKRCAKRIMNLKNSILKEKSAHFVVAATSYPERVFDYGEGNPIVITNAEVKLYEALRADCPDIIYGDYAGTNPNRKDLIVMARGWIPRIDISLALKTKVYWKRRPKGTTEYKGTYCRVAQEVTKDSEFPYFLKNQWGIAEILNCADGFVPSSTPAFWISVRMYNHIYQQLNRLNNISQIMI